MAEFQPPPTYAEVVLVDERTQKGAFNPIWLKWFIDLAAFISSSGGGSGGAVVHNDTASLQGGSSTQRYHLTQAQHSLLTSPDGTYTPALTNVGNLDGSTAFVTAYAQLGTKVLVGGRFNANPTTTATLTTLGMALPVSSNFALAEEAGGTAATNTGEVARIEADVANNRLNIQWTAVGVANAQWNFLAMYQII